MKTKELIYLLNIIKTDKSLKDKIMFNEGTMTDDSIYQVDTFIPIITLYAKYFSELVFDSDIFDIDIVKNESSLFYLGLHERKESKNNNKDLKIMKLMLLSVAAKSVIGQEFQQDYNYQNFTRDFRALIAMEPDNAIIKPKGIIQSFMVKGLNDKRFMKENKLIQGNN